MHTKLTSLAAAALLTLAASAQAATLNWNRA